jgi:CRP-like cAMP-binding protein
MFQRERPFRNHLLRTFGQDDLSVLAPYLKWTQLELLARLETSDRPIKRVFFPETGVVSVVAVDRRARQMELALVGYEGVSGSAIILGDDRSPNESYVQVRGEGHWLKAEDLRLVMRERPAIRDVLLRYLHAFGIQLSQTALSGRLAVAPRLARRLLMIQDRLEGATLPLTHDLISIMLGVRRPSVTDALHWLEGTGAVRALRGRVVIRDRGRLEHYAEDSYGIPEREYLRLFGRLDGGASRVSRIPEASGIGGVSSRPE